MDLNTPTDSRFYVRLATESHNCWDVCASNAAEMLAAIQQFAGMLTPTSIDSSIVVSKALSLSDGIVASGSNRFDANVIAKYEFQTGTGNTAYDTSGVDPAADLTLSGPAGSVTWAGGWGINIAPGGKAQASTAASKKIYDLIQSTGEFSIEAWVAPASVAADNSYMVSYSGGDMARNFTLGQTKQDYDFMLRNSASDLNGMPQLATPDAAMALQASLQHVVLTYDPVNGRQIYVNGVNTGVVDPAKGDTISNWDASFALVLGNEVSGDRSWSGLIKFVAIHDRALTAAQVVQNYKAGVGQRYFMLFNVADVTGVSQAYVMFTVSQYDSYSYLFSQPTFISLDPTATPDGIPVKGIRIGINGAIPNVGQAYIPLDTTVTASNYTAQGEVLSPIGTVIPAQNPATDQFFLTFDQLGSQTHVVVEPAPAPPPPPVDLAPVSAVGVRTFAGINATMSAITGVPTTQSAVNQTYLAVQQQLPSAPTVEGFLAANQVGIAQLAIQYCSVMVNTPSLQAQMFPGVTFSGSLFSTPAGINSVTSALAARVLGQAPNGAPLNSQPAGVDGHDRARLADRQALQRGKSLQQHGAGACRHQRGLRRGARQRRHVDQLDGTSDEEVRTMSKKPKAPGLNEPLRHADHSRPRTRREFVAQGFMTGAATVLAPTLLGMFAAPKTARAALSGDIQALLGPCGISLGAGLVPFICFDLAGGGNIAGSNALVGGPGGQLDFLTTAGYNKLGLPGTMIPSSSASGSFVDSTFGLRFHSDSAHLRGMKTRTGALAMTNTNGTVIPALSQNDTNVNPHNPMYGIYQVGARGALLDLIGTDNSVSGGSSMSPPTMINVKAQPTRVASSADVTGLVDTGQLATLLPNAADVTGGHGIDEAHQRRQVRRGPGVRDRSDAPTPPRRNCSCAATRSRPTSRTSTAVRRP